MPNGGHLIGYCLPQGSPRLVAAGVEVKKSESTQSSFLTKRAQFAPDDPPMELSPARTHLFSGGDSNLWDRFGERAAQPDAGPHGELTNRARLLPITAHKP